MHGYFEEKIIWRIFLCSRSCRIWRADVVRIREVYLMVAYIDTDDLVIAWKYLSFLLRHSLGNNL